jgi:manganese efflux pump family protein
MSLFWVFLLAMGLSFDTFTVSVSSGIVFNQIVFRQAIRFSLIMAFFQGMMPLIGWLTGNEIHEYIAVIDHWIASGLLFMIAARMILGAFSKKAEHRFNPLKIRTQITLALATSIDALVVGFSFALININIYFAVFVIGAVTFLAAMTGLLVGKKAAGKFKTSLEILGGMILIALGLKILIMHIT